MNRRKFLSVVNGALAAASVPVVASVPQIDHGDWPATYHLAVKLPQPKNRPVEPQPFGISYWIQQPTEVVACRHAGHGFYIGEHRGMKLRAMAERHGDKLICKTVVWDGEWNVPHLAKMRGALDRTQFRPPCPPGSQNYKLRVSREVYEAVAEAQGWPKWEHVDVMIEGNLDVLGGLDA